MRSTLLALGLCGAISPLLAQETRFTREMAKGSTFELLNINGAVTITAASGRTLEVVATKTVKRGTGDKVKAIIEESGGVVRVCTLDLQSQPDRQSCHSRTGNGSVKGQHDQVDMAYVVKVPTGVTITAETVNGNVTATGIDRADKLVTVNGSIKFDGGSAGKLNTVNGSIDATLAATAWAGPAHFGSVNGSVDLTLPSSAEATVHGETVTGSIRSDFPQLITEGKYGPKSLKGTLGKGGRSVELQTVNGSVTVHKR